MFSGIFPGSGQTKPGAKGKKLASKAKGKCSGKSDWLMVDSVRWVEWYAPGAWWADQPPVHPPLRYHLVRLKLGEDLPYLITGKGTKRAIASPEEMLALKPELASTGWSLSNDNRLPNKMPGCTMSSLG